MQCPPPGAHSHPPAAVAATDHGAACHATQPGTWIVIARRNHATGV
ncbi:MAG: hypothetical protein ABSG56_23000 [Bryobacteraceae bacterium]